MNKLYKDHEIERKPDSCWEKSVLAEFHQKMTDRDHLFPCIPATIGHSLHQFRYAFLGDPTKHETIKEFSGLLDQFSDQFKELGDYTSLVVFYKISEEMKKKYTVEQFEQLFWQQLNGLSVEDEYEWPEEIPQHPGEPSWEFCYRGERYFIYCATPAHEKRNSRHFDTIMLALTPRWIFQTFNETAHAEKIKNQVRKRITEYDDISIHPELKTYGSADNFEWKQYFLRDDNTTLSQCPFHKGKEAE
ncbi:YqcI/YcgG family protein [Gracilibacillus oryzae]|uniref:YqcI/YcgG family protein n=1 Tax=Gracilibacillus oryzae TaxID=1672701 RepID=A0A7C8GVL7_9BACI|nr:YqcI/YcgG family protein [Gracilibacillus oryzae]KAB8139377.1 YqcI/YcgG family protein [Gracilibacillus oryzae]